MNVRPPTLACPAARVRHVRTDDLHAITQGPAVLIVAPANLSLADAVGRDSLVDWVRSSNGELVLSDGQSELTGLPADNDVVLVLPPRALSWHRVDVPKVGQARLRAVLEGLLEDRLLDDVEDMHFAIEPGKRPGQTMWVAACRKAWLGSWLQALSASGRPASRIVPSLWPLPSSTPPGQTADAALDTSPSLHWAHEEGNMRWLTSASPAGVSSLPLQVQDGHNAQTLLGALMPTTDIDPFSAVDEPQAVRWMADPAVASAAESALGQRFELVTRHDWMMQAASPTGTWPSSASVSPLAHGVASAGAACCAAGAPRRPGDPPGWDWVPCCWCRSSA
jgi:general secretion pathway protein L